VLAMATSTLTTEPHRVCSIRIRISTGPTKGPNDRRSLLPSSMRGGALVEKAERARVATVR
jgi:hypothetical protein